MQTYTLRVAEIKKEAEDVVTICFKQPGLKKIKYLPGQYLTLILRINGRRYLRPYSFSSAPQVDNYLEVTVKRVLNGIVSNHIVDKLKVDDVIEVMPPLGDFVFNEETSKGKHITLWGAGSGITPLMSIAKYILHKQTNNNVTLVYGNRDYETAIFGIQIEALEKQYNNRFSVKHFITKPVIDKKNPNIVQGRIKPLEVLSVVESNTPLNDTLHYICGPAGLKESVKEALIRFNVNPQQIFFEDFEVVRDPKDFEDIITRNVNIIIGNNTYTVEVVKGKSILEAGLDADIELSYSCQTGNCSLCKGQLNKGQVKVIGLNSERDDLEPNERLLCCSFPLTDNIEIIVK